MGEIRHGKYRVPVVRSTFQILEELSRVDALGLSEITERTRIPKSTVFRVLSTLLEMGYVVRDERRNYAVSLALAQLGSNEGSSTTLRNLALPYMLELRNQHGETVNLGVLNLDKVMYAEVVPSEFALRLQETRGASVFVHASALGKAILANSPADLVDSLIRRRKLEIMTQNTISDPEEYVAELKRVKSAGFAFDRGETSLLACCVAAPVLDTNGTAVAAISISGPASRFNPRKDSPVIASLLHATGEVSSKLQALSAAGTRRATTGRNSQGEAANAPRKRLEKMASSSAGD